MTEAQRITAALHGKWYLRHRAITCALPDTLRFHSQCWNGLSARRVPAMAATSRCVVGVSMDGGVC